MSFKKNDVVFLKMFRVIFAWFYLVTIILLPAMFLFCYSSYCSHRSHREGILSLFLSTTTCVLRVRLDRITAYVMSWEVFHKNDESAISKRQLQKETAIYWNSISCNFLFLNQYNNSENGRSICKKTTKVFFKCHSLWIFQSFETWWVNFRNNIL